MLTSVIAPILIIVGVVLLVLGSLPVENKIEGNNLIVKFVIGKKTIDISDADSEPLPSSTDLQDASSEHIVTSASMSAMSFLNGKCLFFIVPSFL